MQRILIQPAVVLPSYLAPVLLIGQKKAPQKEEPYRCSISSMV